MKALSVAYLFTPKGFVADQTIIFDETIIEVGPTAEVLPRYSHLAPIPTPAQAVLVPGFINLHVHLEFSAHTTQLKYGRFLPWLYSVISQREALISSCDTHCMEKAIAVMVKTGTTTFGAISSYGLELPACVNTPAKVIYFNELIGSEAAMADILWSDFSARLEASLQAASPTFFPALAIHSPYATHPVLIKKALAIAKEKQLLTSAHFLESPAEYAWLSANEGEFVEFFKTLLKQENAVTTPEEFLALFASQPTLLTHGTQLQDSHFLPIKEAGHTIVHCPVSNRLLGNGVLDIKSLYEHDIAYVCATDGLSSNTSLNILDELKAALFMHEDAQLEALALSLLHAITTSAGEAVRMPIGKLMEGYAADMVLFTPKEAFVHEEDIALHLILGNLTLEKTFINGAII